VQGANPEKARRATDEAASPPPPVPPSWPGWGALGLAVAAARRRRRLPGGGEGCGRGSALQFPNDKLLRARSLDLYLTVQVDVNTQKPAVGLEIT